MNRFSLLIAACALATTFSGCYMDRTPTLTLEDRAMMSDKEIAEYEAKKAAEGSKKGAPVGVESVSLNPAGQPDWRVPADACRFGKLAGRRFMAGTWSLSDGSNVMNLEIWAQSASGEWRKIVSAGFEANGTQRVVLDDKTGFVSLLVKKFGSESETEVFRYDLGAAVR